MKKKSVPMRLCIGCEEFKEKKLLLRVVHTPDDEICVDHSGKKAGRGAYICANQNCFEKAYKAKRLERAFKQKIDTDIYEKLRNELSHE